MVKHVFVYFTAKAEHVDAVKAAFAEFCVETRKEPGCISYDCYQESAEPTNFLFVEAWKDDAAAKAHVGTKHMDEVHRKINGKLRRKPRVVRVQAKL